MYHHDQAMKQAATSQQFQGAQLANAPRDKPPTMVELDALANALQRLENTAEALDEQLGFVKNNSRGQLAHGVGETGAIQSSSPLVEYLQRMTYRTNAVQERLATLRDTIEV